MSKPQFDSTLGGNKVLPYFLNVGEFVSSRTQEIAALSEAMENPIRTSIIKQQLPKHMQRRIMSHNSKRLPVRLRQFFDEVKEKSGNPTVSKRPRRKYRRRPSNLLNEYNRRQRQFVWLETHIWHAKRFRMTEKWGYKIADFPNDKSFRACYRATKEHCLLQDISYHVCVEISGNFNNIINNLNQLTNPNCGLTFSAKAYLDGKKEGTTLIYHKNKYPYGIIGNVHFIWKYLFNLKNYKSSDLCTLWIWIHPAFYDEFFEEISSIFDLEQCTNSNNNNSNYGKTIEKMEVDLNIKDESKKIKKNVEEIKFSTRNVPFSERVPKYKSKVYKDIKVNLLKDTLNRFRLIGSLSHSIITDAFTLFNSDNYLALKSVTEENGVDNVSKSNAVYKSGHDNWIKTHYINGNNESDTIAVLKKKQDIWDKMKNKINDSGLIQSKMILPIIIKDPRFHFPEKRTKVFNDINEVDNNFLMNGLDNEVINDNVLWNENIRDAVTNSKLTTDEISKIHSKQLIPGVSNDNYKNAHYYLPILIIQNPGSNIFNKKKGFGCGWDVVMPAGWAMPIWLSLVLRGARVGGLRESNALLRECSMLPILAPDSEAGQNEDNVKKEKLTKEHFKKPPAKRPNYIKLGIVSPFHYPWKVLVNNWKYLSSMNVIEDDKDKSFYVLRDRFVLEKVSTLLNKFNSNQCDVIDKLLKVIENIHDFDKSLISVSVITVNRGSVSENSTICLPLKEDLDMFFNNNKKRLHEYPVECTHDDINRKTRLVKRKQRLKILQKLKKKRRNLKEKHDDEELKLIKKKSEELIVKEEKEMKNLWLPNDIKNVKESSSRNVMGFVTSGDYSFTNSSSSGLGYVTLTSLISLCKLLKSYFDNNKINYINKNGPLILTRQPFCYKYSFTNLNVVYPLF